MQKILYTLIWKLSHLKIRRTSITISLIIFVILARTVIIIIIHLVSLLKGIEASIITRLHRRLSMHLVVTLLQLFISMQLNVEIQVYIVDAYIWWVRLRSILKVQLNIWGINLWFYLLLLVHSRVTIEFSRLTHLIQMASFIRRKLLKSLII